MSSLKQHISLVCLFLLITAGACGDDDPATSNGDPTNDTQNVRDLSGSDASTDTGVADVAPETVEEPTVDLTVETGVDLVEEEIFEGEICDNGIDDDDDGAIDCRDDDCDCEVCTDLIDNNDDDLIDCNDPDCSDEDVCPEYCQNLVDDDGDGLVDCDDEECASTTRCDSDPTPIDTYTFDSPVSYFNYLQYPPAEVPCCFDYNEFPGIDNGLNAILSVLSTITPYDAQWNMDYVVYRGTVALLLEWPTLDGPLTESTDVDFNLFRGMPTDPVPTTRYDDPIYSDEAVPPSPWGDGNGLFQIMRESFDVLGPRIRFEENELVLIPDGGIPDIPWTEAYDGYYFLEGGPHFMSITIPIDALGLDLSMTLNQARIQMVLDSVDHPADGDDPAWTEYVTIPHFENGADVGGGRLGGYVFAKDLFDFINLGADGCACAKDSAFFDGEPLLEHREQLPGPNYWVSPCNTTWDTSACNVDDHGDLCGNLSTLCSAIVLLPEVCDVDANKNGVDEAISVGLFFDIVGARWDDPIIYTP